MRAVNCPASVAGRMLMLACARGHGCFHLQACSACLVFLYEGLVVVLKENLVPSTDIGERFRSPKWPLRQQQVVVGAGCLLSSCCHVSSPELNESSRWCLTKRRLSNLRVKVAPTYI